MRSLLRCFLALVVSAVFVSGAHSQTPPPTQAKPGAPQTPARDTKAPKTATGVIKGRVVAAGTGAPLRRARLVLSAPGLERPLHAATDAQGRYEFTELPAGRYTLTASKNAYVTLQHGQRRAFEAGKPIELADGATLDKVDFALPRGCVISGTVVDDLGEPVASMRVTAYRSRFQEGRRGLVATGRAVETNDLGQYRLFGLQPGTYCVGTLPEPGPSQDGYSSAPSYYPNVLNPADAQALTVRLGQERTGVALVQPPGRLARLSGMAFDAFGRPLVNGSVALVNLSSGSVGYALNSPVRADGSFSIANVSPGEYVMAAVLRDQASNEIQQAALPVTVVGEDIGGFVLQITPGASLSGRIVADEGTALPPSPGGLWVEPFPLPTPQSLTRIQSIGTQGYVKDDWTFAMKGVGGVLLFRTSRLPAGYMVRSVLLDGRDITDVPLDVSGTEVIDALQVVLTSRVTEVNGAVADAKRLPVQEYAVLVFAEDAVRWKYPSRFLATARPDQQGRFRIANLPRGRYLAVALEYLEEGQSEDPDYLEALRPLATRFTLGEGETKTLDLKVTKADGT
jgi:hypothetical protein